jgi:hypothetical protein
LLDWPVGTLSGRLSRGRQLLKDRLQRRGLTASAGMLTARFPGEALQALPPRLAELTIKAALGSGAGPTVSTSVMTLTQGVLNAMLIHSLKRAALILVSVAAVTGAFGFRAGWVHAILGADERAAAPRQAETKPATAPVPSPSLPGQNPGSQSQIRPGNPGFGQLRPSGTGKNSPNMAAPQDPIPVLRSQFILVVESPDGKGFAAMSTEAGNGDWKRYELPAGQTATPIVGGDVATFVMFGETITEIAAFSAAIGEWAPRRLLKPIKEQISPSFGVGCALFQEGNNFYAFSVERGHWDVLSLQEGEKPRAGFSTTDITVQQGDQIFVFLPKQAKWSKGVSAKPLNLKRKPKAVLER